VVYFKYGTIEVSLEHSEINTIIDGLGKRVCDKHAIETHWVNHPDAMDDQTRPALNLLRQFGAAIGRADWADYYKKEAHKHLDKCLAKKDGG